MKTSKYGVHVHDMQRSVELQGIKLKCLMAVFWYIKAGIRFRTVETQAGNPVEC